MIRHLATAAATALLLLGTAPYSSAAPREKFEDTFTESNFCGTGVAVSGVFESSNKTRTREGVTRVVHQGIVTWTFGHRSVVLHFAGQFSFETVEGDLSGIHVNLLTSKGLSSKVQLENGRVLLLDAGLLAELVTLTPADETLSSVIVTMRGPHPLASSGGSKLCEVVTEALGI